VPFVSIRGLNNILSELDYIPSRARQEAVRNRSSRRPRPTRIFLIGVNQR